VSLRLRADLALVLVAFLWGGTFVIVKQAIADCSTLLFLALRFSVGAIAMAVWMRGRVRTTRRELLGGTFAGVVLMLAYITQTAGLRYTTASKSGFITGLYIVLVPLFAGLVYRSVPGWREWLGVIVATVGMALMTLDASVWSVNHGDLLTLVCAVFCAIHLLVLGKVSPGADAKALALVQIASGAALCWLLLPVAETPFVRWSPGLIAALVGMGTLVTAVTYFLQSWGQQHTTPTRTALIFALEPVFAAVAAVGIGGETLTARMLAGGTLILAGVLAVELKPAAEPVHP